MISTWRHIHQRADLDEAAKALGIFETPVDAYVRVVYTTQDGINWRYCIGQCVFATEVGGDSREDYPGFIFVSRVFHGLTLKGLLASLVAEDGFPVAPDLPPIRLPANTSHSWREEIVPSHATSTGVPARRFRIGIEVNAVFSESQLIAFDQPYRPSAERYAKAFLRLNPRDGLDRGEFTIEVPDSRGAIAFKDGSIAITGATVPLRLVGEVNGSGIDLAAGDAPVAIDDKAVREVELWLLVEHSALIDYISTSHWPYKYPATPQEAAREDALLTLIYTGESELCEFKPWIDLSNQKAGELEKTVCAFSNHKGGTLLIGVSKEAEIVGIARQLTNRPDELDKALADFEKAVRRRLNETLKNCLCFRSYPATLAGEWLLVIEVEPVPVGEVNYLVASNIAYIRHGATSARMLPSEIQAKGGASNVDAVLRRGVLG
jgi:hypothetical protein